MFPSLAKIYVNEPISLQNIIAINYGSYSIVVMAPVQVDFWLTMNLVCSLVYLNLPLVSSAENEEIRLMGLEYVSMIAEKLWKKILSLETDKLTSSKKHLKETKTKATGWNWNCKDLQASVICQNFMYRAKGIPPDENMQTNNNNNKKILKNSKI